MYINNLFNKTVTRLIAELAEKLLGYTRTANNVIIVGNNGNLESTSLSTITNDCIKTNTKGLANGVASLDSSGKLPSSLLTTHSHGDISSTGTLGSVANKPLITTTNGRIVAGLFGNTANSFCEGNDSRLSDARPANGGTADTATNWSGKPSWIGVTKPTYAYNDGYLSGFNSAATKIAGSNVGNIPLIGSTAFENIANLVIATADTSGNLKTGLLKDLRYDGADSLAEILALKASTTGTYSSMTVGNSTNATWATKIGSATYPTTLGTGTKPIYIVNGVLTECPNDLVTLNTTQTISGAKSFTSNNNHTSGHYFHNWYDPSSNSVYEHYYPSTCRESSNDDYNKTSYANLRVWDGTNHRLKAFVIGGNGELSWDGNNVLTSGDLANYVTTNTQLTISGDKIFNGYNVFNKYVLVKNLDNSYSIIDIKNTNVDHTIRFLDIDGGGNITTIGSVGSLLSYWGINISNKNNYSIGVLANNTPYFYNASTLQAKLLLHEGNFETLITSIGTNTIKYGGSVLQDNISPFDMGLESSFGANRFAAFDPDLITVERFSNGAWSTVTISNSHLTALVRKTDANITLVESGTTVTTDNKLRITFDAVAGRIFFNWLHCLMRISTNGCTPTVKIEGAKIGSETTFETIKETPINGWSGWNSIPISLNGIWVGEFATAARTDHYKYIRFTFSLSSVSSGNTNNLAICSIHGFGSLLAINNHYLDTYGVPYYMDNDFNLYTEGGILPKNTLSYSLGSSSNKWYYIYGRVGNFENLSITNAITADLNGKSKYLQMLDLRGSYPSAVANTDSIGAAFMLNSTLGITGNYSDVLVLRGWSDSSGGNENAIIFSKGTSTVYHTQFPFGSNSSWGTPYKFLDSNNYTDYVSTVGRTGNYSDIIDAPIVGTNVDEVPTWGINARTNTGKFVYIDNNYKLNATDLPKATTSSLGAVKAYHSIPSGGAGYASLGVDSNGYIGVPIATSSTGGVVKPDGTTITINNGVISATTGGSGTITGVSINGSSIATSGVADIPLASSSVNGAMSSVLYTRLSNMFYYPNITIDLLIIGGSDTLEDRKFGNFRTLIYNLLNNPKFLFISYNSTCMLPIEIVLATSTTSIVRYSVDNKVYTTRIESNNAEARTSYIDLSVIPYVPTILPIEEGTYNLLLMSLLGFTSIVLDDMSSGLLTRCKMESYIYEIVGVYGTRGVDMEFLLLYRNYMADTGFYIYYNGSEYTVVAIQ